MRYDFHPFQRPMAGNHKNPESTSGVRSAVSSLLAIPELSDGFDSSLDGPTGGLFPVSYYTDTVTAGTYSIHVVLEAAADLPQVFLFTGRKLLRDIISLKKGERYENIFYQSIAEIIPRYHEEVSPVRHLFFTICAKTEDLDKGGIRIISCYAEPALDIPVIYLCGDSTVTDQSSGIPYHPGACYSSWGQALPAFLGDCAAVENQAHCGLTTETFRSEGHMDIVKNAIRPGDFCLIQFGHNDQKLPHLQADREYPLNLKRYVGEVRAAKATPILVTSPGRNIWNPDGSYHELLAEHTAAVKQVAAETKTALIDLHHVTVHKIIADGLNTSRGYFHPGDYTHTNEYGAVQSASFIAGELCRLYPETFPRANTLPAFPPPPCLWDTLTPLSSRTSGAGQKEQFDTMEKSVSALLEAIETAKVNRRSSDG